MKNFISKFIAITMIITMLLGVGPVLSLNNGYSGFAVVAQAATTKTKTTHLAKTKITITEGKTYQQKLLNKNDKTISNKKIKWKTANKKIATINSSGKITAVKRGTVKMTATYNNKIYSFNVVVNCAHKKVKTITEYPTCTKSGKEVVSCSKCKTAFSTRILDPYGHSYTEWKVTKMPSTKSKGEATRTCITCDKTVKKTVKNAISIPSVKLGVEYVIGDYNQKLVDDNDVICNFTEWGNDDPVVFGHNYNSLSVLTNVKVGDIIYFARNGKTEKYKVTHSEYGKIVNNGANIQGIKTGKMCLYDSKVPTLHLFTCVTVSPYAGANRWMVVAEKV